MIPRTLHYCWFGGRDLPESTRRYIDGWRRLCPDFEIRQWDETNFPIDDYPYARQAYDAGKYAFVSDVARLYALAREGGIYLDTDVEMLQPLTPFLDAPAFMGFERERRSNTASHVATCVMGSEPGSTFATENLEKYRHIDFLRPDGSMDTTTNVARITEYMQSKGLTIANTTQHIEGIATIYPYQYFCPRTDRTGTIRRADRGHNYTIHHYDGSWLLCNTPEYVALRRRYKPIPYFIRKKLILAKLGINTRGFFPTLLRLTRTLPRKKQSPK